MTMGTRKNTNRYLDDHECFMSWYNLGSLVKVRNKFISEGLENPRTGKPPTPMAIWVAAMRWVVNNAEEAREFYKTLDGLDFDPEMDEDWWKYVIHLSKKQRVTSSRTGLKDIVLKYGIQEYYQGPPPLDFGSV